MKGICYYNQDLGRGGPDGYLAHYCRWCIDINGKKLHIGSDLTGSVGFPPERGGLKREVSVAPCDGSCQRLVEIDDNVLLEVTCKIDLFERQLTTDERAQLPVEYNDAAFVSELSRICRGLLEDLKKERVRHNAGLDLLISIKQHLLHWFFRAEIARYEEAIK